jgi:hypothetical protein
MIPILRYGLAGLAIFSLLISALPLWFSLLLCLLIVLNGFTVYQANQLCQPQWLNWRAGDEFLLWNYTGQFESLHRPRCHRQGAWWIISGVDSKQRNKRILISPDMLTAYQQRQLTLLAAIPNTENQS